MPGRLDGKVCLITGGGSGMGRVATRLFAREGAAVLAVDLDGDAATASATEATEAAREAGSGGEARGFVADVTSEEAAAAMVAEAERAWGGLDVLYNNAGIFPEKDHAVVDTPEDVLDKVLSVNLKGVWNGCKHGIPAMERRGGGSVINIGSFVAILGCTVPQDAYTASKGAVIALTRSLAVQHAPKGVRVNTICPGPIATPLIESWLLSNPEEKKKRLDRIPLGRLGQPEDVVWLAVHLASDESAWTNGAVLVVDGGITANYF